MAEREQTSSATVRKRATIHAMIALDVEGDSDEEIAESLADALGYAESNTEGVRSITLVSTETIEVPFVVPPGAERWAALAAIRFGEEPKRVVIYEGSWWWTNGAAMYRCEGDPPDGFKKIEEPFAHEAARAQQIDRPGRKTEWSVARKERDGLVKRTSSVDDQIAVQSCYVDPVTEAYPSVRWECGSDMYAACKGFVDGKLVAIVMPCRRDTEGRRS